MATATTTKRKTTTKPRTANSPATTAWSSGEVTLRAGNKTVFEQSFSPRTMSTVFNKIGTILSKGSHETIYNIRMELFREARTTK
jgi:hypothetical protein